jgi:hypothetical protein
MYAVVCSADIRGYYQTYALQIIQTDVRGMVVPNLLLAIVRTIVHIAFTQVPRSNHREPCIV